MISDEAVEAAAKAAYEKDNPTGSWQPSSGGIAAKYLSLARSALKSNPYRSQA